MMISGRTGTALFLLAGIFLLGCTGNFGPFNSDTFNARMQECAKIVNQTDRDSCYGAVASLQKNAAACAEISSTVARDTCHQDLAVAQKSQNRCDKITGETTRISCYSRVAIAANDESLCETILDYQGVKNQCYYEIATAKRDKKICLKITDDYLGSKCVSGIV